MRIIGKQLVVAWASAVRPLRKPGADTVRQMPGFCVMNPAMEAAYPAFCSWRNEITRRPEAWSLRVRSVIGMPGSPKIVSMPFSFSASMTSWKPSVVSCGCAAGAAAGAVADSVTVAMDVPLGEMPGGLGPLERTGRGNGAFGDQPIMLKKAPEIRP